MADKIKHMLIFVSGAVAGAVPTWLLLQKKYELKTKKEIDQVKAVYSRGHRSEVHIVEDTETDKMQIEYSQIVSDLDYGSDIATPDEIKPYIISPFEYGNIDGYGELSLTYYFADGILCDENNKPIRNIDDVVGRESLLHFGDYEDDSVYVRNDKYKYDVEILLSLESYEDVLKTMPHPLED